MGSRVYPPVVVLPPSVSMCCAHPQSDQVRSVLRALDAVTSTYSASFAQLCKEVFAARAEANDNVRYLSPLRPWFEQLELLDGPFEEVQLVCGCAIAWLLAVFTPGWPGYHPQSQANFVLRGLLAVRAPPQLFRPIMHGLLNVWKFSRYFNTPARLVMVVREVCNCITRAACQFVSSSKLFDYIDSNEASIVVDNLLLILKVCGPTLGCDLVQRFVSVWLLPGCVTSWLLGGATLTFTSLPVLRAGVRHVQERVL